nr:hypothetical protein GCM10020093_094450 [Planobispora longispora]
MGLGHHFAGTEQDVLADPLRDVVGQLLCLPVLGRLLVALHDGPEIDRLAAQTRVAEIEAARPLAELVGR